MAIKTVELTQVGTVECKMCSLDATHVSFDTQGDKKGPQIYHCRKCRSDARNTARFFITGGRLARFNPHLIEEAI